MAPNPPWSPVHPRWTLPASEQVKSPPRMRGPQPWELQQLVAFPATTDTKTWVVSSTTSDRPGTVGDSNPANVNAACNKARVGSNAMSDGPKTSEGSNPANADAVALSQWAATLTSSMHCTGSMKAVALASPVGATPVEPTTCTADTTMAGSESHPGHSLMRCPFWWQL